MGFLKEYGIKSITTKFDNDVKTAMVYITYYDGKIYSKFYNTDIITDKDKRQLVLQIHKIKERKKKLHKLKEKIKN